MSYSKRFDEALLLASELHREQRRKASEIPYVTHLLAVAALVGEAGGDEDEVIAALLHDSAEDQGGQAVLDDIRARFGDRVADIVDGCSDTFETPKPPWKERKLRHLEHLSRADSSVRMVVCADKIANTRSVVADLKSIGNELWERFNGGRDGTLWYYRSAADTLSGDGVPARLALELSEAVERMEQLAEELGTG